MLTDAALCDAAALRWKQYMLRGDFASAWRESDFIASTGLPDPHRLWNGECWGGKHVILRCLHGLGDAIQFIRYASLLKQTCRQLTVQARPELTHLLACAQGVDRAITWQEPEGGWDLQMEVMELPRIFRTELHTIPGQKPYIQLDDEKAHWGAKIISDRRAPRVGLIWRASSWEESRSMGPRDLEPILAVPRCKFFVLQKDADGAVPGHDVQKYAVDVADTAALMLQLDLVISVDTMTAHLAGALGRPTWLMLPAEADWRWMKDRNDSPWYPTMRLFRQTTAGNWQGMVGEVARALRQLSVSLPADSKAFDA